MSLQIHTGATPNGWKVTVMIEELIEAGVDLPEVNYHTVSPRGDQFTDEYMAINTVYPARSMPTSVFSALVLNRS